MAEKTRYSDDELEEFRQIILIRVRESEQGQLFMALRHACDELQIEPNVDDMARGDVERLFAEEFPNPDAGQIDQFRQLLAMTEIPDQEKFVTAYSTLELNGITYEKKTMRLEHEYQRVHNDAENERFKILKASVDMMDKHGISVEEVSEHLKGRRARPR